ncbi:probable RNA-binding protein 23 isoform X1 [Bufo gargarizans]|uniref:probable RNA-binding protein 23 isoform X1 n=1 Tax=Bufo gargarizans TaxID=30331 RepID=UPI001CF1E256|nr:probable RNA-binding protein 23 isoform X1 [Bufo gargarizans]
MASDDYDIVIEAMLEAPYQSQETEEEISNKELKERESRSRSGKNGSHSSSSRKSRTLSRDRRRSRSRSRERHRRRSSRHRSHERRYRSRSGGRGYRSRSRDRSHRRERSRHYSPGRRYTRSKSRSPRHKEKSPLRKPEPNLTPEERDARTVFCMQLAARIRTRDLEDFFSAVGKVRDVRIISDRNSRRSKGIAYVEFVDIQSVPLAIGLTGQRLLGVPIIVQVSQAEKNRLAAMASNLQRCNTGPMRLYVGSLHFNITEEMLTGIFEPFGKIEHIQLLREPDTGRSKGYGFITFVDAECARRALEQLNGFELAGRPMKVGLVTDRADGNTDPSFLDNDDLERSGIDLGATGRLQLMAKLAEGTGLQIPLAAQAALQLNGAIPLTALNPALSALSPALSLATQPISTQYIPLSQLFNLQSM